MTTFPYSKAKDTRAQIGLVVLQSDETIEDELRHLFPRSVSINVTRVPSAPDVTPETLQSMAAHLTDAASLFPQNKTYDAIGYGCTSGTAQIGSARIASLVRAGAGTHHVTEPVTALTAACHAAGITRLAFLSPYVASVSGHLRRILANAGIETPVFGSFDEGEEAAVIRIDGPSIRTAARQLFDQGPVDGVFLSCTNLRTFDVLADLQRDLGVPVLSSNLVLGWHLMRLAGVLPSEAQAHILLN